MTQESLLDLYNKLSRKANTDYYGERVGPGWLKYEYNDAIWNLDDGVPSIAKWMGLYELTRSTDSDYTIFVWRQQQQHQEDHSLHAELEYAPMASTSQTVHLPTMAPTPTLHLHNPRKPLPIPPAYLNPSYFTFQPSRAQPSPTRRSPAPSHASVGKRSKKGRNTFDQEDANDAIPELKRQFDSFHSANGVRTVMGTIGPVQNGGSFSKK